MKASFFLLLIILTKSFSSKIIPFIWRGQSAKEGQFPHQVAIRLKNGPGFCSGAILNSRWILTARHCIKDLRRVHLVVGSVTLYGGTVYDIERAIAHPHIGITYDIGLMKSNRDIQFDWKTKPIQIDANYIGGGVDVFLSGWGTTEYGSSNHLNWIGLRTISNSECQRSYRYISPSDLCASDPSKTACHGDSGSALITQDYKVVGIVSRSIAGCGENYPQVYVRVSEMYQWIQSNIRD